MTEPTITCPNCKTEIKLTESLAAPLIESTRRDFEQRLALKDSDIAKKEEVLREREEAVTKAKQAIDDQVAEKLLAERARIAAEESKKAKLALQSDIETIANRELLKNKVAAFVITRGQDNVQAVAGQMLSFFAEIGCIFPQFPYVAHSRGWSAEDMENNGRYVQSSSLLHDGAAALVRRCIEMAEVMIQGTLGEGALIRGGRKRHLLDAPGKGIAHADYDPAATDQ